MQELKSFLHNMGGDAHIAAVGCSATPRDAEGSYMPCFLAGVSAAETACAVLGCRKYSFSHQNGHVMAALYSSGRTDELMQKQFLAFHVSGGTTEVLRVTPNGVGFDIELVGETDDINAGQAIDRVGVAMGLSFPCGRELEALAAEYKGKIYKHSVTVRDCRCSLSGAENIALKIYRETQDKQATAAFVFDFICKTLIKMTEDAMAKYGESPVLYAGGVMSNHLMRGELSALFDASFAEPAFSADNAAGIALLCRRATINGEKI
jgi:N6-L-threonylcarbamoyladenine synthase